VAFYGRVMPYPLIFGRARGRVVDDRRGPQDGGVARVFAVWNVRKKSAASSSGV